MAIVSIIYSTIYGIKLGIGYSENIIDFDIADKISPEEQFKAFNDLAHFRGLKTGFRTIISEDQLKVSHPFYKNGHTEWFKFISDESSLIRTVESIISNLT